MWTWNSSPSPAVYGLLAVSETDVLAATLKESNEYYKFADVS
jgi:hypothetical protein